MGKFKSKQPDQPEPIVYILLLIASSTIFLISTIHCYNLDYQKALIKNGPKGSYFGYSIAQHSTFDAQQQNNASSYRSYLLVGAPRADAPRSASLLAAAFAQAQVPHKPGAIYKCDFSLSQSCQLIDIDSMAQSMQSSSLQSSASSPYSQLNPELAAQTGPSSGDNDQTISGQRQSPTAFITASSRDPIAQKDDQWLGVSVKSQGPNGYAMACAHRYVLRGPHYRWPQGICYSLTKNLTLHKAWQPCLNRPVNKAHEEYGFCQAGTSGDISDSSDIVLGSPGPYTWRGTVFSNSIQFSTKDDRTWYMAPVQDDEAKVYKYSYLGMSLVTGRFFNKQQYYVSGAPRSNDIGQVLVMTKQLAPSTTGGRQRLVPSADSSNFKTEQILDGEQMASSFGYTLAKMDFNGDGHLDLIVAAPFYYSKNEGGAVYAYANDGKSAFVKTPTTKLTGKPESRFGLALANCGDLNRDKYDDLAVGAPYDPQGGSVYIYSGSKDGLKSTPSQVIRASTVASNLQTFGYSLSGGQDMDLNGYPDLAVGSYADDMVFILRARPIIEIHTKIEGNLTRIDPNKTTCDGEKNQLPCFKFNTCFELDPSKIGEYSDSMRLKYRIEAETFTGQKYSRVKFQEAEQLQTANNLSPSSSGSGSTLSGQTLAANNIVEKEILIDDYYRGIKIKRCQTQRVYIKDRSDVQTPIQFKLTYSLVPPTTSDINKQANSNNNVLQSTRYSLSSSERLISSYSTGSTGSASYAGNSRDLSSSSSSSSNEQQQQLPPPPFPILNQDEAQRIFSAKFLKDCGSNDVCESHLDVDGSLQVPRETLGINEPGYPTDKQINVTIRVSNNNEPAYESKLFVTHPAQLSYGGFRALKQVAHVECNSIEKNLIKCDLGNPMPKGTTKLLMIFNTQNQAGTFEFNLMVNTTSQNAKEAKTSYDLVGTIKRKVEVQIPQKQPPVYPEVPTIQEPPAWLILVAILLGILLFSALFYCLYVNGFFERSRAQYMAADTEDRYS